MAPITIDEEAKRSANLRVLQRSDSSIIDIVGSATHVVLYEFDGVSQQWVKRNVEGSLFVAKRTASPRFKIVVMNRNSKDNLEIPLASTFQMQVREPYLIFRLEQGKESNGQKISGIWFHDGKEREAISEILQRVVKSLSHADEETKKHAGRIAQTTEVSQSVPKKGTPVNKSEAAASLIAALRIGSSSESTSEQEQQVSTPKQQPQEATAPVQNMVLDKKSLQLSLMSLLQDERFLDLIHAQYLKVAQTRAKANQDGSPKK
mmetsp:Transcript_22304/g.32603  ORF Transcript_22304/g.32603 Transcript_22304/m.32603 type:complete len:262 (-) Transcript_22304:65-850(-)|eukprot:CAMPEP_0197240332 /NCGR_PEP_ID=MMETSP1429-20130617/6644_1 /TAXON_ID=49237 /ORGANISM="Chaetoceros  sp., Strain UNC1202" /LENGTH=261 /DNA_ID=CAMNT_0042699953 /DNA_START=78 /DNA_END=863 /DNA_ORIENTATION=+